MKEVTGDLWELQPQYDAICVTTNGFTKKNGDAVMGRGVALQAAQRYPMLPSQVGASLRMFGNHVNLFYTSFASDSKGIFAYPVKHHWRERADLWLIRRSAQELVDMTDELGYENVLLPRPGCGNGGLDWEQVKPIISSILDDRFTVVNYAPDA